MRGRERRAGGFVRPFAVDGDLAGRATDQQRARLERLSIPAIELAPGEALSVATLAEETVGELVLQGFLVREYDIFGRRGAELLGPGDLLTGTYTDAQSSTPRSDRIAALTESTVGVLDADFARVVSLTPGVLREIMGRATGRARRLSQQNAISQLTGVAARLIVMLWHLADLWGVREKGEVVVPIPLQHDLLADLVAAQRSSVTRALGALRRGGLIDRCEGGGWVLHGLPPAGADELILVQGVVSRQGFRSGGPAGPRPRDR